MNLVDKSDGFFVVDNQLIDVWARVLGPGPLMLYCLFKRMCKGSSEIAFPQVKREDWAEYIGVSSQTFDSYIKKLRRHNLLRIESPKGVDRLQHKPHKYILTTKDEWVLKEKDLPKPLSNACKFNDPIHSPGEPLFKNIKIGVSEYIKSIYSGVHKKYGVQLYNNNNFINTINTNSRKVRKRKPPVNKKQVSSATILTEWNKIAEKCNLSKILKITSVRSTKINARTKEELKTIKDWVLLFEKISDTPFLLGDNDRQWKVTFDWLIENDTNYLKVLEGKFTSNGKTRVGGAQVISGKYGKAKQSKYVSEELL